MKFAKYHGTGNDFVLLEDLEDSRSLSEALVAGLCDRHKGVGADGVIRITTSRRADFFMDYWNADGNVAEMCGNGIRCLAKYVFDRSLTSKAELDIDTRAGVKRVVLAVTDRSVSSVLVDMGKPAFTRKEIPMTGPPDEDFVARGFSVDNLPPFRATAVSMGNPHLVLLGETDPAEIDVRRFGPLVEQDGRFPERTNVEFVRVEDDAVTVRVWERGSGETMACGTGACASLVAASRTGLVGRRATVRFPGGDLKVEWRPDDHVYLDGPATFVFEGELDPAWVRERLSGVAAG
jgi:diaminopimelate epimerase